MTTGVMARTSSWAGDRATGPFSPRRSTWHSPSRSSPRRGTRGSSGRGRGRSSCRRPVELLNTEGRARENAALPKLDRRRNKAHPARELGLREALLEEETDQAPGAARRNERCVRSGAGIDVEDQALDARAAARAGRSEE